MIVETLELVASDATLFPVGLFSVIQHRGMLGEHVGGMALLATGVGVLWVIKRPQPVLVAPMRFLHRIKGSPIPAVAGRAAEFFDGMEFEQIGIGMTGERRVSALGDAE